MVDLATEALAALNEFGREGMVFRSTEDPAIVLTPTGILMDAASLEAEQTTVNLAVWFASADFAGYVPVGGDTLTIGTKEYEVLIVDTRVSGGTLLGLRQMKC